MKEHTHEYRLILNQLGERDFYCIFCLKQVTLQYNGRLSGKWEVVPNAKEKE